MTYRTLFLQIDGVTDEEAVRFIDSARDTLSYIKEDRFADVNVRGESHTPDLPTMQFVFGDGTDDDPIEPNNEESTFSRYMKSATN